LNDWQNSMANKPLNTIITIGGSVSAGLKSALGSTASMLTRIGKAVEDLKLKQDDMKAVIDMFEIMGKSADRLRLKYQGNITTLGALAAAQTRLKMSQERQLGIKAEAAKVGAAGSSAKAAGKTILGSIIPGVKEAKQYESEQARIRALGLGEQESQRAFKFAGDMKQFGLSQVDKLQMMRDAMALFGNERQAEMVMPVLGKIKFGNLALFGKEKGEENVAAFVEMMKVIQMRGGLDSPAEFEKQANIVQRMISSTGGSVGGAAWRDFLQQSGVMGASMESEALFYSMAPLVQKMGGKEAGVGVGALYNSMYQGTMQARQFKNVERLGLIGDAAQVDRSDKSGRTTHMNPGALLGSELFTKDIFRWMNEVLVPQLNKNGVTGDKKILETFASISADANSSNFLADMYLDRKNIALRRETAAHAQDTGQVYAAGQQSIAGNEAQATARLADAKRVLGMQIIPLYTRALTLASDALDRFNTFSERNPRLTGALVIGVTALGVGLAVVGPLLVTAAGAMGLYGASQLMLTRAIVGGGATRELGMLGRALAGMRSIVPGVLAILRPLALAFALAAPPMALVVGAAIAVAAAGLLIWKYWEPLKAFFSAFGSALMTGLAPLGQAIMAAFAPVWTVLGPIVMPLLEAMGRGVSVIARWFGELLAPISATSQLTSEFGKAGKVCGDVVAAAFILMLAPIDRVVTSIKWIGENIGGVLDKAAQLGAGVGGMLNGGWNTARSLLTGPVPAISGSAPALPPVRGTGAAAGASSSQTYTYNITQQPGQDARALAEAITQHQQRMQAVTTRSNMRDNTQ
jgi:hypothetical protein